MKKNTWTLAVLLLLLASLACKTFTGLGNKAPSAGSGVGDSVATQAAAALETITAPTPSDSSSDTPTAEAAGSEPTAEAAGSQPTAENLPGSSSGDVKTEFPLPANISNLIDLGNGSVTFQAKMSLKDAIAFYRESFLKQGYKEREINTAITAVTFSLVFDGHPSGKAIVVQGVDLGGGSINIIIRLDSM